MIDTKELEQKIRMAMATGYCHDSNSSKVLDFDLGEESCAYFDYELDKDGNILRQGFIGHNYPDDYNTFFYKLSEIDAWIPLPKFEEIK